MFDCVQEANLAKMGSLDEKPAHVEESPNDIERCSTAYEYPAKSKLDQFEDPDAGLSAEERAKIVRCDPLLSSVDANSPG